MLEITYDNKIKIQELYLHDFKIREFIYNDIDKYITMKCKYLKKEAYFKFINIKYCEIVGTEKWGDGTDIIDWYDLPDNEEFTNKEKGIKAIGMAIAKDSMDTIKIYCEKIEVEEKEIN